MDKKEKYYIEDFCNPADFHECLNYYEKSYDGCKECLMTLRQQIKKMLKEIKKNGD